MNIFVDLDGVLADFDAEYERRFKETCPGIHVTGEAEKSKWRKVRDCGDFFLYIPWTKWGRDMWGILEFTGAHILTATPRSIPEAAGHKIEWCRRELGIGTDRIIYTVGRKNKMLYCGKGDILLDDNKETINMWREAGGVGLLVHNDFNVEVAELAVNLWRKARLISMRGQL